MKASKRHDVSVSTQVKHGAAVTRFLVLVAVITALGWGSVVLSGPVESAPGSSGPSVASAAAPVLSRAAAVPAAQVVLPATGPLTPDPALLSPGDTAPLVRAVQARRRGGGSSGPGCAGAAGTPAGSPITTGLGRRPPSRPSRPGGPCRCSAT